jgi:hypothetical protein
MLELRGDLNGAGNDIGDHVSAMGYTDHGKVAHAAEQSVGAERPIQPSEQLIR